MLYIHVDEENTKNYIDGVDYFFNTSKQKDWFNDVTVKKIIKDIDNTIAVKDEYLESPIYGGMSPDRLSTGCKALILMLKTDEIIYATRCGDNCAKYILEIAKHKELHIMLHHCIKFPKEIPFEAKFVDSGVVTHSGLEYALEYYRVRKGEYKKC